MPDGEYCLHQLVRPFVTLWQATCRWQPRSDSPMSDTMVRSNRPTLPQRPFNPRGLNRLTKQTLVYLPRHRRQGRKLRRYCYAYGSALHRSGMPRSGGYRDMDQIRERSCPKFFHDCRAMSFHSSLVYTQDICHLFIGVPFDDQGHNFPFTGR